MYTFPMQRTIIIVAVTTLILITSMAFKYHTKTIGPSQCNRRVALRQAFQEYATYMVLEKSGDHQYSQRVLDRISDIFRCKFGDAVGDKVLACLQSYHSAVTHGNNNIIMESSDQLAKCLGQVLGKRPCDLAPGIRSFTNTLITHSPNDHLASIAVSSESAVRLADLLCGIVI